MTSLLLQQLYQDKPSDIRKLQHVLEAAPAYSLILTGQPVAADDALLVLTALPANKTLADKFVIGLNNQTGIIGCADIIRGYPDPAIAFIGLLLFAESAQGRGNGTQALHAISDLAASWGCTSLRIAVIEHNTSAMAFWLRKGFVEIYRKPAQEHGSVSVVMEKALEKKG